MGRTGGGALWLARADRLAPTHVGGYDDGATGGGALWLARADRLAPTHVGGYGDGADGRRGTFFHTPRNSPLSQITVAEAVRNRKAVS